MGYGAAIPLDLLDPLAANERAALETALARSEE